jgi:hypothetical protein
MPRGLFILGRHPGDYWFRDGNPLLGCCAMHRDHDEIATMLVVRLLREVENFNSIATQRAMRSGIEPA